MSHESKIEEIKQLVEFRQCTNTTFEWKMRFSCFPVLPGSAEARVIWGGIVKRLITFLPKISKSVHICQSYSKSKVGRILRHGVLTIKPSLDVAPTSLASCLADRHFRLAVTYLQLQIQVCFLDMVPVFPNFRGAKSCDQRVCMSVCPLAYLKNHMFKLHEIFCTCYMWPWFGSCLTTVQYVMYFRFCGWRHVFT